jgi:hypothetical protein
MYINLAAPYLLSDYVMTKPVQLLLVRRDEMLELNPTLIPFVTSQESLGSLESCPCILLASALEHSALLTSETTI